MTKTDWIDYFEAVNGRTPSEMEIAQALAAGEFVDDSEPAASTEETKEIEPIVEEQAVELTPVVNEPAAVANEPTPSVDETAEAVVSKNPETRASQASTEPTRPVNHIQNQIQHIQQSQQFNEMKAQGLSYFNWFIGVLKNPANAVQEGNFIYSLVTLGLAALTLGFAIVNAFSRLLFSTANLSVAGESLVQQSPEHYARYSEVIRQQFGFSKIMTISIYLFVLYALVALLPSLVQKLTKASEVSIKEGISHNVMLMPAVTVVNLIALVLSFLIPDHLNISGQYMGRIQSLASSLSSGSFSSLNQLFEEIPALSAVKSSMTYILFCILVGFILLMVTVVKNSKGRFAKVHDLYVSVGSVLVFLLLVYFIDSKIFEAILGSFVSISNVLNGGF